MRRRNQTSLSFLAPVFVGIAVWAGLAIPRGVGPGPQNGRPPHPGVAVKRFDARWIPVTTRNRDILQTLRELRLETSTMWFRIDCSDQVYDRSEIELVFQGGTVWVAAGQPRPTAPPARCLNGNVP